MKPLKPKKCRACLGQYQPRNSLQVVCSPLCAIEYYKGKKAKKAAKQHTIAKREFKLNDKVAQKKLAWNAFSKFIRLRDKDLGCISCGTNNNVVYAAGHFRSRGAIGALMFHEDNVHKQCNKHCNSALSGNYRNYKPALISKIGQEKVDWLEGHHEPKKYSAEDYVRIKKLYLEKYRNLLA